MKPILLVSALVLLSSCRTRTDVASHVPIAPPIHENAPERPDSQSVAIAPRHEPAAPAVVEARPAEELTRALGSILEELNARLLDVLFDYDQANLTTEAVSTLQQDARLLAPVLNAYPRVSVLIEGHCDERGSAEYNLGLGDLRASRAVEALENLGLARPRLRTISYGRERPLCVDPAESCWRLNRRAHMVLLEESAQ